MDSPQGCYAPGNGSGRENRGSPIYSAWLYGHAASPTPVARGLRLVVAWSTALAFARTLWARHPHWNFRGCRVRFMLRPGRSLAPLERTFTLELSPVRSPRTDVEYDYVGRQPVPTAGLTPASHAALWAAQCPLYPFLSPLSPVRN